MKTKLSFKEIFAVGITLFGMFFGAGNLIFPIHMGQLAGSNVYGAIIGFIVTGVTIPVLAVAAIGITHSDGLQNLCDKKVGKGFGYVFTTLLYLTIGPFFAIPRCCTTTFTTGVSPLIGGNEKVGLLIFSAIFFGLVLFFSLRPTEIMTWVGKVITPVFLAFLAILVIVAMANPGARVADITPDESYMQNSFFNGFLEGYNTMDAIAGLAFGIIIVECVKKLGVENETDISKQILKAGIVTAVLMGVIYFVTTVMGTQSRGLFETSENGGVAFSQVAQHYLGNAGIVILALTIGLACLKTAIGLVTSTSEAFSKMFPKGFSYKAWVIVISVFAFAVSNVGLTAIINYSIPFLMLLYPIAIVLIILSLFSPFIKSRAVFIGALCGAFVAAIIDFIRTLPFGIDVSAVARFLPLYDIGFSWLVPSIIGLVIGIIVAKAREGKKA